MTSCQSASELQLISRFLMHDLTKITSRKSTTKVITFYFRIPTYAEYLATTAESEVVAKLFYKPSQQYTFAFKRVQYEDVCMSFMFKSEEEAKGCIQVVSDLYKRLKSSTKKPKPATA